MNPYMPPHLKPDPPRPATIGDYVVCMVGTIVCVTVAFYFLASLLD